MFRLTSRGLAVAVLVASLLGGLATAEGQPEASRPSRSSPLPRRMGVKPWELDSTSPQGSHRTGGIDQRSFVFSPDGKLLAGEDAGGWQLELWDVATGESRGKFGRISDPVALAFAPDGKTLLTASGWTAFSTRHAVELWEVAGRKRLRSLDEDVNTTAFAAVAFAPDGRTLALAVEPGRQPGKAAIHLWDAATGDEVRRFEGPSRTLRPTGRPWPPPAIDCLCFAPDGRSLAVVSDHRVFLWELSTGRPRCLLAPLPMQYTLPHDRAGKSADVVAFSPDGGILAVGCWDGLIRRWDTATGAELSPLPGHAGGVRALVYPTNGDLLLSFGWDGMVRSWPLADRAPPSKNARATQTPLTPQVLGALWEDLGGADHLAACEAVRALAADPAHALPFLRERLRPVPRVDSQRITALVRSLRAAEYTDRKKAAIELRRLGEIALPALRQANERDYDEITRKIQENLEADYPTRSQLQALRAVYALERMATAEARQVLTNLAGGAAESSLTREAQAALERLSAEAAPGEMKRETLWDDLALEDARRAYRAMRALAGKPAEGVALLRERLQPLTAVNPFDDDPKRLARLIADLSSDQFAARDRATKELSRLGPRAEPALRRALRNSPDLEARRRLETLLAAAGKTIPPPDALQMERAVEVLERIGMEEARRVLRQLRDGRNSLLKEAAAGALRRLARR